MIFLMKYYKLSYDYENDDDYVNCDVGVIGDMDEYSEGIILMIGRRLDLNITQKRGMFYQIT